MIRTLVILLAASWGLWVNLDAQTKYISVVKYNKMDKPITLCQEGTQLCFSYNQKQKLFSLLGDTIQKIRENKRSAYLSKSEKLELYKKQYTLGNAEYYLKNSKFFNQAGEVLLSARSDHFGDRFEIVLTQRSFIEPQHLHLLLVALWDFKLKEEKLIFYSNQIQIY